MTSFFRPETELHRPVPLFPNRNYDIAWLGSDGSAQWQMRPLPASPTIESACASIGRGGLVETEQGPVAVEDLIPGDRLRTATGGFQTLLWVGSRSYDPHAHQSERPKLLRVGTDALGEHAPKHETILAAAASVLIESPACERLIGHRQAFAPLSAFEDGISISAITPPGEITVYNLALERHDAVMVNGLWIESYHPARNRARFLNEAVLNELSRLLPHLSLSAGFGPQRIPSLSITEARMLEAQAS